VPAVLHEKVNPARAARSVKLANLAKRTALLLRRLGWSNFLGRLKHSRFINWLVYRPAANVPQGSKEAVSYPEQLVRLYHAELESLSVLLNADYSKWRSPTRST